MYLTVLTTSFAYIIQHRDNVLMFSVAIETSLIIIVVFFRIIFERNVDVIRVFVYCQLQATKRHAENYDCQCQSTHNFKFIMPAACVDNTHTYTHLFYGPLGFCPGLPRWAGTRKVKPIWIHWSKRSWVAVASAGLYANLHLTQTHNHPSLPRSHHSVLYQQRQSTEGIMRP